MRFMVMANILKDGAPGTGNDRYKDHAEVPDMYNLHVGNVHCTFATALFSAYDVMPVPMKPQLAKGVLLSLVTSLIISEQGNMPLRGRSLLTRGIAPHFELGAQD